MKNKTHKNNKKPIHLHVEHISTMPIILGIVSGLFAIAVIKSDGKMFGIARQAYAEGMEHVSSYMRQETVHGATNLTASRTTTISGH